MRISLCMIGQDEAHCVAQNLASCIPCVDEIIFIDGGSKDETRDIVSAIPKVTLYDIPFPNNFSDQRNHALARATGDYVLIKDCDEVFGEDILANLQRIIHHPPFNAHDIFAFSRRTYIDGRLYNLSEPDYTFRFWKHNTGIHFAGKLHEQLFGYSNPLYLNVHIEHRKSMAEQLKDDAFYETMGQRRA